MLVLFSLVVCAVLASDAPQTVGIVNTTGIVEPSNGTSILQADFSVGINTSSYIDFTIAAMTSTTGTSITTLDGLKTICSGHLILVQNSSVNIDLTTVALVPCDNQTVVSQILAEISSTNPACTLMYSLESQGCVLTQQSNSLETELGTVFTMLSSSAAGSMLDIMTNISTPVLAAITPKASSTPSSIASDGMSSSAIIMAVLYSITGVVACFFLFVIVSGAVRVHKHPERYGLTNTSGNNSEDGLGSDATYGNKAKGLARAVLDSIPLVTFRKYSDNNPAMSEKQSDDNENEIFFMRDIEDGKGAHSETEIISIGEELDCPICFESFKDGDIIRALSCQHKFHADCIDNWLLNTSSLCPLCRVDLSIEKNEQISQVPPSSDNIVIPNGYQVDVSYFNRFLDIWNAQLLPKESRRAVLARFREEAELRRRLRQRNTNFDEQNRNLWIRFVNSRRHQHQNSQIINYDNNNDN